MEQPRDKKFSSAKEFYRAVAVDNTVEKVNEACYVILHTTYLNDVNYKRQIGVTWRTKLNTSLSENEFLYLKKAFSCFTDRIIINAIKDGEQLRRRDVLWQAIISLEMDIALIDCVEQKKPFALDEFRMHLAQKYFGAFEHIANEIIAISVPFIKDFGALSRALRPYKTKIRSVFDKLLKANAQSIEERVERFKREAVKPAQPTVKVQKTIEAQPTVEVQKTIEIPSTTEAQPIVETQSSNEIGQYEEKIRRLENDLVEYKRQRDEQIEHAQSQYDRGVRDFFKLLNDERYSRIVDYFYALQSNKQLDPNMRSYLENFFMALEELEITPIVADGKIPTVDPNQLNQTYNLTFDRQHYDPNSVEVKYPGWRFKEVILEKPTLAKKK